MSDKSSAKKEIEFERWVTPFSSGEARVFDLKCDVGSLEITFSDPPRKYRLNDGQPDDAPALQAKVFDSESEQLYLVSFETVNGVRYLDERGLTELWGSENYKPKELGCCFRVRNHMWHRESPITFLFGMEGEWSYLITTLNECLEIVSAATPVFENLGRVECVIADQSDASESRSFSGLEKLR